MGRARQGGPAAGRDDLNLYDTDGSVIEAQTHRSRLDPWRERREIRRYPDFSMLPSAGARNNSPQRFSAQAGY